MKRRLEIWYSSRVDLDAVLEWRDGVVVIVHAAGDLKRALEDFISNGLNEWVGPPDSACPRTTASNNVEFLPRLGALLKRQGNFSFDLKNESLEVMLPNTSVAVARDPKLIRQNSARVTKSIEAERKRIEV
jgi:hypothetical protein